MNKKMTEPPIAIMLTMPQAFFEDRKMSEEEFMDYFETCMSEEDNYWNFRLKNLPTCDVAICYIVFGAKGTGKVHYRCNVICYERSTAKSFNDTPDGTVFEFPTSNWVLLSGPVIKAPKEIPWQGFQGFRYLWEELF